MSLYQQYQQQAAANTSSGHAPNKQRVVTDGWGASGSVFCADSSLRFIYETHAQPPAPGSTAAAISSLASGEFAKPTTTYQTPANANPTNVGAGPTPLYDKLGDYLYNGKTSLDVSSSSSSTTRGADGVDLFEAEIARACAAVTKQTPSLPHSFRECSVCLMANAHAQIARCGHTFHPKCFLRWFRSNRSCPLCRGPVDKIQCAPPVLSVQDELEALMAEMDEDDDVVAGVAGVGGVVGDSDPLMESSDLMSLVLGGAFDDADMDMMPLDDMPALNHPLDTKPPADQDDDVSMDDDDENDDQRKAQTKTTNTTTPTFTMQLRMPPTQPQFAPSSTMPNYWNVLNQGLAMPPVMPTPIVPVPASTTTTTTSTVNQQHHRPMVHIAPKPDGHVPHAHAHAHAHAPHIYGGHVHPFVAAPRAASTPSMMAAVVSSPMAAAATTASATATAANANAAAPRVVSCRCTGGCRNGRCACVKEGGMCGAACRCTSCKNPFLMVKAAGADIDALLQDACFMHNVSKTRDMVVRMQEPVDVPCCARVIKVIDCVQGYTCTACTRVFDFSWCMNKLLDHDKTPRNHCDICKRCCDHRDVHCHDCGRCYFAGVAASLPCPCKESSRKRRDLHQQNQHNASAAAAAKDDTECDEKDGECSIM